MLWSEKYRDDFAQARAKGREDGYALGHEEGLTKGRKEGLAEGREEGLAEGREAISRLADRLDATGRGTELIPALRDPARTARLMRELGLAGDAHPAS